MKDLDAIIEEYPEEEFLRAEGFDECILGVEDESFRLIYSVTACLEKLIRSGLEYQDAVEHFELNVSGSHLGPKTPIWCYD